MNVHIYLITLYLFTKEQSDIYSQVYIPLCIFTSYKVTQSLFVVQFMIYSIKYFLFDKSIKRSGLFLSVQMKGKDMQIQDIMGSAVYREWVGISLRGRIQSSANCRMSNIFLSQAIFVINIIKQNYFPPFILSVSLS